MANANGIYANQVRAVRIRSVVRQGRVGFRRMRGQGVPEDAGPLLDGFLIPENRLASRNVTQTQWGPSTYVVVLGVERGI